MPMDRFLIAPFNSGLQRDLKPWLIPEDAFTELNNAYVFRGRVRKRFGGVLTGVNSNAVLAPFFSRVGINLGPTVAGTLAGTVPGNFFARGQAFTIGSAVYTVITPGVNQDMLQTVATTTATFSTTNGAFNFVGAPAGDVYFYPSEPIMGIANYESGAVNDHPALAFDTQFAYRYVTNRWVRTVTASGAPLFHGDDADFFWTANWEDITANLVGMFTTNFYVTNYNGTGTINDDPIWVYRGGDTWTPFSYSPILVLNPGNQQPYTVTRATASTGDVILNYVQQARIIVPFKDRLVMLNTVENNANGATQVNVTPTHTTLLATTGNLSATYNNGAAGVGATLTNNATMAALTIDGVLTAVGNRILVKDQSTTFQNGIYTVTTVGSGAVNWVITRAADYDQPAEILTTDIINVTSGTINANTYWSQTAVVANIGIDPILFALNGISPVNYLTSTNTNYVNRCRYSHNGSPFAFNAWLEPNQVYQPTTSATVYTADGGGFIDAPTEEEIISAEFIKDRLIVFFERSTWELAYTGNQVLPFVWQKINTELGAEATFSTVPFDQQILTVGNTGVHSCNGANVIRVDDKIPDEVFDIRNKTEGVQRVFGIRDYFTEMVYWTFPSSTDASHYPNRVLVYNYKNGAWAFNDDSITAWGYFEQQTDRTWASMPWSWLSDGSSWNSGVQQSKFRQVVAGNQQGFIFIVDSTLSQNAQVTQIANMTNSGTAIQILSIDHNLVADEYVMIETAQGITEADPDFPINGHIFQVLSVTDSNTITVGIVGETINFTGTYTGGGTMRRISQIDILSKQWNPYMDNGRNVFIQKIDFGVLKTAAGEVTVDYYPSASEQSMIQDGQATNAILGNNILETHAYDPAIAPFEAVQDRLWHPVYFQSDGECIQIRIYMNNDQMLAITSAMADFELEGMILHTQPTTSRLQ